MAKTIKDRAVDVLAGAKGRWLMGRYGPHELLDGIGAYVQRVAPERADELLSAIRTRREELAGACRDMVVDQPSEGMLEQSATVLAAYEVLVPIFDGDERRTVRYLQHVFGGLLRRPLGSGSRR